MEVKKETVKNKYGTDIVKCCASCMHNTGPSGEYTRICNAGEGIVKIDSYCTQWEMKRRLSKDSRIMDLDAVGKGDGKIKKKKYLDFLLNYTQSEDPKQHKSVSEIREEYEARYGSVYLNNI